MSTTKVFIIFGICVLVVIIPLTVLYVWFPSIIGRYNDIIENIIVGLPGAYVVALALDFTLRRRQERALAKVARVGLTETSRTINHILSFFASMIKASSTEFKPSTIDDLFSIKAAELISLHLALDRPAPVTSKINWKDYISSEASYIIDKITSIQNRYQAFFPYYVLTAVGILQDNTLLAFFKNFSHVDRVDTRLKFKRPVLNITPQETLNSLLKEILICIKTIQKAAIKLEASVVP